MTFPVEIVTCLSPWRQKLHLFCKYEGGHNHDAHRHRGGVSYEAEVYRKLLQHLPGSIPRFYGSYQTAAAREVWLILDFLQGRLLRDLHLDVRARPQPTAMGLAARWIGRFHALTSMRLAQNPLVFLNRYDPNYYLGWAERTYRLAGSLRRQYPRLETVCRRASELLTPLIAAPPVVIHGEYYQNNIVVCGRTIYPTDWESAAIAPGEIDLAALTEGEGWKPEIVRQCLTEYKQARWPAGAPAEFPARLAAARLYLHFRWLGERRDWTLAENNRWRLRQLADGTWRGAAV